MAYFPLFVELSEKKVVVIGGGNVAARKVRVLSQFGPNIEVISPEICEELVEMENDNKVIVQRKKYTHGDLAGAYLAVAATSDHETNLEVYKEAIDSNVLINSTDGKKADAFNFPSIVKRGDIVVGISTSGDFPLLSGHLRSVISDALGPNIHEIASILRNIRESLKKNDIPSKKKDAFLKLCLNEIINAVEDNPILQNRTLIENKINRMYRDFLESNKL